MLVFGVFVYILHFGVLYSWQDDNFKYSLHLTAFSAAWETFNGDEPPTENLLLPFCTSILASEQLKINLACCLRFHLLCELAHTSSTRPLFLSLLFSSNVRDVLFVSCPLALGS